MADCKCGAPVTYVRVSAATIPLERHGTVSGRRYVVTDFEAEPWQAEEVDQLSNREGHADHRESCPFQR